MKTDTTTKLHDSSRREFFRQAGVAGGSMALGFALGCGGSSASADDTQDAQVLNFALNLEYLEAEYYLRGTQGRGLTASDRGAGAGNVIGGRPVQFQTALFRDYAFEIANDEEQHVKFLRSALGEQAVAAPEIDFTNAFAALGFDPFADEISFLLGAFVFEDVGVTAYNGASTLIQDKTLLGAAASILAVEAYHAGNIRTALLASGMSNSNAITLSTMISDARNGVNPGTTKDQPVTLNGAPGGGGNIVPTDEFGLAFGRSVEEVLNIVYLNAQTRPGGFFPEGLNGTFR